MKGIPKDLSDVAERLRNGAKLSDESKACGFSHNGPLREALRKLLGADGYNALMAGKRPIMVRQTVEGTPLPAPAMDDAGVPVVHSTPTKDGWKLRYNAVSDTILLAPDGAQYVKARANEKATLIVDLTHVDLNRTRFRTAKPSEAWRPSSKEATPAATPDAAATPEAPAKRTRRKAKTK